MSRSQREIQLRALIHEAAAAEAASDLQLATRLYRRAVALAKRPGQAARAPRLHARALHGLGRVLEKQGRYRPAAAALRAAVEAGERAFGPRSLEVANALNDLG